jgi:uncharacterized protein YqeY
MAIVQQMREQLRGAMKARDKVRTDFLRYWIAGLTLGTGDEMADDQAIKKMRSVLKEAQTGRVTFSPEELELIKEWVPATVSREQIRADLAAIADQIRAAPKEGMAMGVAMKALAGKPVESDDVKAVIAELRA